MRRLILKLIAITGIVLIATGIISIFMYSLDFQRGPMIKFSGYINHGTHSKTDALTQMRKEFSPSEYGNVTLNEDLSYFFISPRQDDWDGLHFIFDLSNYDINTLESINFTWIGTIWVSSNCDCRELWYYTDDGWVNFDNFTDITEEWQGWVTKTGKWTSDLANYIDDDGKVHLSVVVHVKDEMLAWACLMMQFVDIEVSQKMEK